MTNPAESQKQIQTALAHQRSGQFAEAESIYRKLLAEQPKTPGLWNLLGALYSAWGDHPRARESFARAVKLDPSDPKYLSNLAAALARHGDVRQADRAYRSAIKQAPEDPRGYFDLINLHPLKPKDTMAKTIEAFAQDGGVDHLAENARPHAWFAVARFYEDRRAFAKAFRFYERANNAIGRPVDIKQTTRRVSALKKHFTRSFFDRRRGYGLPSETPVFMVGLPCSGAAYVEAVLSTHPKIHVAGQRQDIGGIARAMAAQSKKDKESDAKKGFWAETLKDAEPEVFTGFAAAYLQSVMRDSPLRPRLVDTLGDNFLYVGLIHLMFPNARIIHVVRDPLDVCFACYAQYFADGHGYAFDLKTMGQYYKAYQRLMEHWESVLPGRMYELRYEDLRRKPVSEIRGLMEHLDLPWDAKANPPKKIWAGQTPEAGGAFQAGMRQAGEVGRAKPFAKYLGALKKQLKG